MSTNNDQMNAVANSNEKGVTSQHGGNWCKTCTNAIVNLLENGFAKLGGLIARNTIIVIIISFGLCLLFLIGLVDKYEENRPEKLWVSSSSESLKHRNWFSSHYPSELRTCQIIVEGDNFLTPAGLGLICNIDEGVKGISKNDSKTPNLNWSTKCFSPARNGMCSQSTILQLWQNNCTYIRSLDQSQIIAELSVFMKSAAVMNRLQNLTLLLGGVTYDNMDKWKVMKAKATRMTYFLKNEEEYIKEQGRRIDERGTAWEEAFVELLKNESTQSGDTRLSYYTLTSQLTDSRTTITGDLILLGIGYILIIFYLAIMLGSFSRLNHKVWLAVCGVVCIGLSFGVSYGLSSAFQLMISPVHNVLPFLLLGIGVDDIFVIIQTWQNIAGSMDQDATIPDKIAHMMKHAGVSILVTSFTDVCAFLIGATTVLPALRSFCVFAGIGIIAVFILTCTFFVAWLTLDARRQQSFRDACCCIKMDSNKWSPMECSKRDYLQLFIKNIYSKALLSLVGRIFVMVLFVGILAGGAYGLSELKQNFDPDWFLPPDSMTIQFKTADKMYFPDGVKAAVYVGKIDYFAEQDKLTTLYEKINADKYVVDGSVVSWYESYTTWLRREKNLLRSRNESEFYKCLDDFLSSDGAKFRSDVIMDTKSKKIKATRIKYSHIKLYGASQEIKAMDGIQDIAKSVNFNNFQAFGYTRFYIGWETNKIISTELIRNLILAGVVVLVVTLFLLADVAVSFMVLLCMVTTLIDIAGYMHFWGMTVDTVTTILLVLAIGLSVDYSAHIAHAFMASREGSRVDRARNALITIGPAVFHGGFSTFLAFICLSGSKSYVFSTFFKLFLLVVVFGLFHGLVFLPVLLSFVGSRPYDMVDVSADNGTKERNETEMKRPTSSDNRSYDGE